ncbi:hypothetical protein [Streptomyces rochei]|uniref:hypothetical protein n=1 Tax=Streptomyces rochei TaxID=1928 RepID=UPI003702A700
MDGTLASLGDHYSIAEQSKNHRNSAYDRIVINAATRFFVAADRPLTGNRNNCRAMDHTGPVGPGRPSRTTAPTATSGS